MSAMSRETGQSRQVPPASPTARELENAVREADGGVLPKGWPAKYSEVIAAVLAAMTTDERVRAAWRARTLGPAQRASGVGLLVITDRQVIGTDHNSKSGGSFAVPVRGVAAVEVTTHKLGAADVGGVVRLRDSSGAVLGSPDHPAEMQIIKPGHDPSGWDSHVRSERELAEVERSIRAWLPWVHRYVPVADPATETSASAPSPAPAPSHEPAGAPPRSAVCAVCHNERPVAKVVKAYTAVQRSSTRKKGGAYKAYETRTELSDVHEESFDVCAQCERKDTRTMSLLLAPSLVAAVVLAVLWLAGDVSGWWFALLLVPLLLGALLYNFVGIEDRLVAEAVATRRPGLPWETAGREALHAGWVDREGVPIQTTSTVVGFTESQYRTVAKQMKSS